MEFLEKEKELRRLQIEKEPTIASAEESAIKRILEKERLLGENGVTSDEGVRHELKPDVRVKNIKEERSLVNPYAPPFSPRSHPVPAFEPSIPKPAITPYFQDSGVNTTPQQIVSLQADANRVELVNYQSAKNKPSSDKRTTCFLWRLLRISSIHNCLRSHHY